MTKVYDPARFELPRDATMPLSDELKREMNDVVGPPSDIPFPNAKSDVIEDKVAAEILTRLLALFQNREGWMAIEYGKLIYAIRGEAHYREMQLTHGGVEYLRTSATYSVLDEEGGRDLLLNAIRSLVDREVLELDDHGNLFPSADLVKLIRDFNTASEQEPTTGDSAHTEQGETPQS